MEKLAEMLVDHLDGFLTYLPDQDADGSDRGRQWQHQSSAPTWPRHSDACSDGHRDMNYLLLKVQGLSATKTEFLVLQKAA
jgi:hypothetical protein